MSIDAMKQALEALEELADEVFAPYDNKLGDAILALRAAIEQAQTGSAQSGLAEKVSAKGTLLEQTLRRVWEEKQKPVAWMYTCEGDTGLPVLVHTQKDWAKASWWKEIPLYTAPRQWQGLTDEEISSLWDGHIVPVFGKNGINPIVFARAIEAKLKEQNT